MRCPFCNKENPDGAKFCGGCGNNLEHIYFSGNDSESRKNSKPVIPAGINPNGGRAQKRKKRILIAAISALAVAAAVIFAALCFVFIGAGKDTSLVFSDFKADVYDIYLDTEVTVTFTVTVESEGSAGDEEIAVYDDSGEFITYMNDDGADGDETAGDLVYTGQGTLESDEIKLTDYYAAAGESKSNTFQICFYRDLTEEEFTSFTQLLETVSDLSFDEACEYVRSSEEVSEYFIDDENETITYRSTYGIYGVWEEYTDDTKGNGEYAIPEESGCDYNAVSEAVSSLEFTVEIENTDVAIIRPFRSTEFQYDDFEKTGELLASALEGEADIYDDGAATLDVMSSLSDYGVILIDSHGGLYGLSGNTPALLIGEELDEDKFLWDAVYYLYHVEYSADYLSGRIICTGHDNRLAVTGKFFDKYYADDSLSGSFWFLGTCYSMYDDSISSVLTEKGAACVMGYTGTVSVDYCNSTLFETVLNSMLLSADTAENALQCARDIYGAVDPACNETEFVMGGDGSFKLINEVAEPDIDETSVMYQLYYDKLMELQEEYGEAQFLSGEYEYASGAIDTVYYWSGLCFASLVDFDSDGQEELITAVYNGSVETETDWYDDDTYIIQIWAYENDSIQEVYCQGIFYFSDWEFGCLIEEIDSMYYIVDGYSSGAGYLNEYYGYQNGVFTLIKSFDVFGSTEGWLIDGAEVSDEEYMEVSNEWGENISQSLSYYFAYFEGYESADMLYPEDELENTLSYLMEYLGISAEEDEDETDSADSEYEDSEEPANSVDSADSAEGEAFAVFSYDDYSLRFYRDTTIPEEGDTYNGLTVDEIYTDFETKEYKEPMIPNRIPWCGIATLVRTVIFEDVISPVSCKYWFIHFDDCEYMDLEKLDTSNVVKMSNMFYGCSSLVSLDLSHFDTSNVQYMDDMFHDCSSLISLDLSGFDTSQVVSMEWMFYGCSSLEILDLSSFDVSNLEEAYIMFKGCSSLVTIYASNWTDESNFDSRQTMFGDNYALVGAISFEENSVSDKYANCETGYFTKK